MGDFRFRFKAEFAMGGFEDKCDMSLNLTEGDYGSVDQRVLEWLDRCFDEGSQNIREGIHDTMERERAQAESQNEERERKELRRLKDKYDPE